MFEKITSGFNKNKKSKGVVPPPQPPQPPEQSPETANTLRQLHKTRQMLNNVYESLKSINFDDIARRGALEQAKLTCFVQGKDEATGETIYSKVERSGTEILNELKAAVGNLTKKLESEDAAELLEIQTLGIDTRLWEISDTLNHSLTSSSIDLDTAKACVTGLIYGIKEGHRPMPRSWDSDEIENELSVREKRIENYKKIIDVSKKIMKLRDTRKNLIDQHRQVICPKFEEALKALEEDRKNHITYHNDIKGISGNAINDMITKGTMTEEHLQAWELTANVVNLETISKQIEEQVKFIDDNMKKFDVSIEYIKTAVTIEDISFDAKLHRQIEEAINSVPDKLVITQETSITAQQSLDEMSAKFKAALNSHDMALAMLNTAQKFKEVEQSRKQEEEREKEDRAARIAEIHVQDAKRKEEEEADKRRIDKAIEREYEQINKSKEIKQEQTNKYVVNNSKKRVRKMK